MPDFDELFSEIQRLEVSYLVVWSLENEWWGEEECKVELFLKDSEGLGNLLHLFFVLCENTKMKIDLVYFVSV